MVQNVCQKYGCFNVYNKNISGNHLYKDGLFSAIHLMKEGQIILARNLTFFLNKDTLN